MLPLPARWPGHDSGALLGPGAHAKPSCQVAARRSRMLICSRIESIAPELCEGRASWALEQGRPRCPGIWELALMHACLGHEATRCAPRRPLALLSRQGALSCAAAMRRSKSRDASLCILELRGTRSSPEQCGEMLSGGGSTPQATQQEAAPAHRLPPRDVS